MSTRTASDSPTTIAVSSGSQRRWQRCASRLGRMCCTSTTGTARQRSRTSQSRHRSCSRSTPLDTRAPPTRAGCTASPITPIATASVTRAIRSPGQSDSPISWSLSAPHMRERSSHQWAVSAWMANCATAAETSSEFSTASTPRRGILPPTPRCRSATRTVRWRARQLRTPCCVPNSAYPPGPAR